MTILTRRWNDLPHPDEGLRLLITRYRPRGVAKSAETWDRWEPKLAPSRQLLARFQSKIGTGIEWSAYRNQYLLEMRNQRDLISEYATLALSGQTITLLCSAACMRETRCHRSLLRDLIEGAAERPISLV